MRYLMLLLLPASTLTSGAAYGADADGGATDGGGGWFDAGTEDGRPDGGNDSVGPSGSDSAPQAPTPAPPPAPAPPASPEMGRPETPAAPQRLEALTVVGTRESRTAGSAHVLRPRDLERLDYDNPEAVTKTVPGVYARGEDGFGLRPNIGIRGVSPDRSKKVTLMEDGQLFGPAPYAAPAAYFFPLMTRMELVRVIKGPGAVSFGPQTVGGAIDLVTRGIPADESGAIDLGGGTFGYGKVHGFYGASTARSGYVIEGVHLRSTGFKELDGGGDTGFEKNEWMWKGRYLLSTDPNAVQNVGLKLGYSDEDSRESYLGLTDADFRRTPYRRYAASRLDRMNWQRTQAAATYHARLGRAFTLDAAVYRNDFTRTWRKVNRMGDAHIAQVLADPSNPDYVVPYSLLTGTENSTSANDSDTIYIGPNHREFVSQGAQAVGRWEGGSGPIAHRVEAGARYHYDRIDRLHTESGFLMRAGNLVPDGKKTDTTENGRSWVHALAIHLTDAMSWGPVTLTPGVRLELIDTRARDRLAGIEVAGAPQRVVIPGLGAYGALTPSLGILAGVYRGFSPAAPGQPAVVKPESSVNYEAGARFSRGRTRLEAIGFFNDYQNLTSIGSVSAGSEPDKQYSAGRARIYGAELFARAEPVVTPGFTIPLMAAYTYTRTELLEDFDSQDPTLGDVKPGHELPFVPRHQGSATAAIEAPRGTLALAATYVSAMRELAGQGPILPQHRTDPSFILDVTGRLNLTVAGHIYLNVRNLTGSDAIAARLPFGARPVAPRWIQVGTKWTF